MNARYLVWIRIAGRRLNFRNYFFILMTRDLSAE